MMMNFLFCSDSINIVEHVEQWKYFIVVDIFIYKKNHKENRRKEKSKKSRISLEKMFFHKLSWHFQWEKEEFFCIFLEGKKIPQNLQNVLECFEHLQSLIFERRNFSLFYIDFDTFFHLSLSDIESFFEKKNPFNIQVSREFLLFFWTLFWTFLILKSKINIETHIKKMKIKVKFFN